MLNLNYLFDDSKFFASKLIKKAKYSGSKFLKNKENEWFFMKQKILPMGTQLDIKRELKLDPDPDLVENKI
jgi:hypothetical protein